MSLIRPEARAILNRWVQPVSLSLALVLALRLIWLGWARNSWVLAVLGFVLAVGLGLSLYLTVLRIRLSSKLSAVGLVEVDERRITYLTPGLGGSLDLDDLRRVAISTSKGGVQSWVLYAPQQTPLVIPLGAEGAEDLPDIFVALPGLSLAGLLKIMQARQVGMISVWEKQR